jgi:hypothetical protein
MDLHRIIKELIVEKERLDRLIAAVERFGLARGAREDAPRGRKKNNKSKQSDAASH